MIDKKGLFRKSFTKMHVTEKWYMVYLTCFYRAGAIEQQRHHLVCLSALLSLAGEEEQACTSAMSLGSRLSLGGREREWEREIERSTQRQRHT
jgi:hypothetical protein